MSLIKRKDKYLQCLILFLLLTLSCSKENDTNFLFCDATDRNLSCLEPKTREESIKIPRKLFPKGTPSREEVGNYLYFQAKETPGVLVSDLPASYSEQEIVGYMGIQKPLEKMEGRRAGDHRVFLFHYLGALLKQKFKIQGSLVEPFPDSLNLLLELEVYRNKAKLWSGERQIFIFLE